MRGALDVSGPVFIVSNLARLSKAIYIAGQLA